MIDISKEITFIRQIPGVGQYLANALDLLQSGTNNLGIHLGADPTQSVPAPATIQSLTVKSDGAGNVHAVVGDNNPIQRGIHYFLEYQQLASGAPLAFTQPHVVHLGASRTMHPMALPANDDNGNPVHYIFRAYSQYPGGHPGEKIAYGGSTPTTVAPGGTARMTLLPSTGSGTASSNGQSAGLGFGSSLFRLAKSTAKRTAK